MNIRTRFKVSQFEKLSQIGRGGYGEIWLVIEKVTGNICVMKILRKTDIILSDQIENAKSERNVLTNTSPWIISMHA
jgi:serine/threonine protein kinase